MKKTEEYQSTKEGAQEKAPMSLTGQPCPFCSKKTLTLTEGESDVPFFGTLFLFSMHCSSCNYHKSDVEAANSHEPARYVFIVRNRDDLNARVVKSSEATLILEGLGSVEPGTVSDGYITNAEGIIVRMKQHIELLKKSSTEDDEIENANKMLIRIENILQGKEQLTITIEDPTGNSAIIAEHSLKEPFEAGRKIKPLRQKKK